MNSEQARSLADFMDALTAACEENGVSLEEGQHLEVYVARGDGRDNKAVLWKQKDPRPDDDEYWHIEGCFV